MEQNIVILGAGYAGVLTAKKLAKRFRKQKDIKITLIDKNRYHTMLTELHEVAAHRVEEDSIKISLRRIFAGRKVELKLDTIASIDYDNKTLIGKESSYKYDYLVLAAGSQPTFFGIPGAAQYTYKLWSYEDALKIREHILDMFRQATKETDIDKKRKLLTFYVIGAGFTGVEMVGELAEWARILCDAFEIERERIEIVNVDMLDRVVPVLPEKLSAKAQRRLQKMGVTVKLKTGVKAVGDGFVELNEGIQTKMYETATVIWTAGIESAEVVKGSAGLAQAGRARIKINEFLLAEGRDNVFVAGDNLFYIPKGEKAPVPQMVENCEHSADTIAHNLTVTITKQGEMHSYAPVFHGVMLSIGGRYGLAHVGTAKQKISLPSFFSMFAKHFINIVYFVQVLGWNKVFSYLHHEFFTIRDCRSFVGGHFSNRTPSFLLVPLRVFLGAYWVYEGVQKITEGWLYAPRLQAFLQSASDLFQQAITGTGVNNAVTSATTASGAAAPAATGSLIFDWEILGLVRATMIKTTDIAIRFQMGLVDWFNNTFIISSDKAQIFFQIVIVLSEIAVGLLLIGGLLTTIASLYSLLLQGLFVTTTGLYLSTWWMVFAAIAVIIGGGRIFGLDYYVMPWLKKHWKNMKIARKFYIYND